MILDNDFKNEAGNTTFKSEASNSSFKNEAKVETKKEKKIVNKLELTLNDNQGLYNGKPINMTPSPYVRDGHTWIPYDLVCEFFNEEMNVKNGVLTIERSI